jgi:hypothetical protein
MLTTAAIVYLTQRSKGEARAGSKLGSRAGAIRRKMWDSESAASVAISVLVLLVVVLRFAGACTIFARSNPKLSTPLLLLVFVLFIGLSDLYLFYFALRWGVTGLRGLLGRRVVDYKSLPYPRGSAPASALRA